MNASKWQRGDVIVCPHGVYVILSVAPKVSWGRIQMAICEIRHNSNPSPLCDGKEGIQITGKNGGMGISPEKDALPSSYFGKRMFRGYEEVWSEQEPLTCIVPKWLDDIREMAGLKEQPHE